MGSHGHKIAAYVGISGETEETPATLEAAIHDAAHQIWEAGLTGVQVQVVSIEFTTANPHITQYRVIAVPGGSG